MAQPTQPNLKEIARYPVAYILMAMGIFVGALGTAFIVTNMNRSTSSDKRAETCETRLYEQQIKMQELTRELLIQKGVVNEIESTVDSMRKK